ncbi:MAG: hypothetical protein QXZ43_00135 [Candidatus Aenigmatarchaeota archaeon]
MKKHAWCIFYVKDGLYIIDPALNFLDYFGYDTGHEIIQNELPWDYFRKPYF